MNTRTLAAVLVVVGALVAVPVIGAVTGVSAASAPANQTATSSYSYDELARGGTQVSQEFPSVRQVDGSGYWLVRYPPSGFASYGSRGSQQFISPSTTVRRQQIRLFSGDFGENEQLPLTVVYWRASTETRTVTEGNTSTTKTVKTAEVIAVDEKQLTLEGVFRPHADIGLREFYDDQVRVTMWSPAQPELRWTFKLKTVATAAPVNINDQSDLQRYLLWWVVLPGLACVLGGQYTGSYFNREGGAGPDRRAKLIGGGLFLAGAMWLFGYVALASLIVSLPLAWAFALGWTAFANAWDQQNTVQSVAFVRLNTEQMPSPLESVDDLEEDADEDSVSQVLDAVGGEMTDFDLVEMPNGDLAVYESGFDAWYARFSGCYTKMNIRNQKAEVELSGGSEYDKLVFVAQDPETELVAHTAETTVVAWPWKTHGVDTGDDEDAEPPTDEELQKMSVLPGSLSMEHYLQTGAVAAVFAASMVGASQFIGSWLWGALAYVPLRLYFTKPVKGYARTSVAPGLARAAWATAFYQEIAMKRFGSITDMAKTIMRMDQRDNNLVEALREARDEESITSDAVNRDSVPFESEMVEEDPATSSSAAGGDD
ncbi:hypothetical protein [Halobaculum sp. P14]|uniref:hypothetical protein n=1 Tax=Halobaculum sp. P14 TaxID=3421638 RepID=UPI003EBF4D76